MTVAVLIVNWNGGDLLRRCLESLFAQRRRADAIVLVDNASTDDSLERARPWLDGVRVIRSTENLGFAAANNLAAQAASGYDLFALLNPDAIAEPDWLDVLVAAAERHPDVAAFASQMRLAASPELLDGAGDSYHVSGRAWRSGHRKPVATWPSADYEVFGPCGAAALYRADAFRAAGGFDKEYFCYLEDVDLAFRLRLLGHRCVYVHRAVVLHEGSALTGYQGDFAVYHGERNAVWTFVKNMPGGLFWLYLPQHILLGVLSLFYYPMRRQGRVVFKAKLDALRDLRRVLKQRRRVQATRLIHANELKKILRRDPLAPYTGRYT